MTLVPEDIAEQQADVTRLLLHYLHAPLPGDQRIRGILPPPPSTEAIRVVTGTEDANTPDELTAWEIPLRASGDPQDLIGGDEVLNILRALHTGTHICSSSLVDTVMDMPLVHVDLSEVAPAPPSVHESAFTILHTLACPWTEEQQALRLRGFLLITPDRLRLYLDRDEDIDVIAADVRPSGSPTALPAALPSLIDEEERVSQDVTDPHCSRLMDLTEWR